MTPELEKEFYDTFGIEPKWKDKRVKSIKTYYTEEQAQYLRKTTKNRNIQLCYPDITAEKLLELICIYNYNVYADERIIPLYINTLKTDVLHWIITDFAGNDKFKDQIQQLFKVDDTHKSTMLSIITDDEY